MGSRRRTASTLGPVAVNFADFGAFTHTFKNGRFTATITNDDIQLANWPPDPQLPPGCPNDILLPGQANTVAGLEALARQGLLYFNVHTGSQGDETYDFGLIRGQEYPK